MGSNAGVGQATGGELAKDWSKNKKIMASSTGILIVFVTTTSSSLPSGGIDSLVSHFNVVDSRGTSLPVAVFLIGYILGPMIFGPLSEIIGRKLSLIIGFGIYTLFTLSNALAPTWPSFLFFRFLVGTGASCPYTILGGLLSDLYCDLVSRGRAVMLLSLATNTGPYTGPIISGYLGNIRWNWPYWVSLLITAMVWPLLIWLPETYSPVVLRQSSSKSSVVKSVNDNIPRPSDNWGSQLKKIGLYIALRPITLLAEPIVFFTNIYIALVYSIVFLYFQSYPIIFKEIYGLSSGDSALAFLAVIIGAIPSIPLFIWYDGYLAKAKKAKRAWAMKEENRRLPLVLLGGLIFAGCQFWLGWTAANEINLFVPLMSGVPNGFAIALLFMGLTNYLTDAYGVWSASAIATSVFTRNVIAALLLIFAGSPLYRQPGIALSCTILGSICVLMAFLPFAFMVWGPTWRQKSKFCRELQQTQQTSVPLSMSASQSV